MIGHELREVREIWKCKVGTVGVGVALGGGGWWREGVGSPVRSDAA